MAGRRAGHDRRGRDGQPGERPVGAPQVGDQRRAVQGVLQARRPRLRRPAGLAACPRRGPPGLHAAALHSLARALRPVGPPAAPRRQALRAARLHHGRCRAAAAGVPALRARRRRLQRPAAQRLARDPAGVEGHRGDPRRLHQEGARPARGHGGEPQGGLCEILAGIRTRAEGGRRRGPRQPREDRRPAALRLDACRYAGGERLAGRLHRPHEGRAGQDLHRLGGQLHGGEEQPAPGNLPQEGHRGAAALRARGRMGAGEPRRVRRQAARLGGEGRPRPGQAGGRGGEAGAGGAGRRVQGTGRKDASLPRRAREGSARDAPPHRQSGLPGGRRARPGRQPGAPAQGGGAEGARFKADPGNQPGAPGGAAAEA